MKTDMKLSSKMTLFIIISCVIILAGVVVGTVCHFLGYGYFNPGADWTSDKSVTVTWYYTDAKIMSDETGLEARCEKAFEDQGISYYAVTYGTADDGSGGDITFKFTSSTDSDKIVAACDDVRAQISAMYAADDNGYQDVYLTRIYSHETETYAGSSKTLLFAGIAVATIVVFEFLYVMIRYKVSMALGGLLACAHNLALYICLVSLCRIPVGTSMFSFAALTVIATMICTLFMFGKMRKNIKDESLADLTPYELTDKSATQSFRVNLGITASLAAAAVVMFVLMSISALSVIAVMSSIICAFVAFVSAFYGTCIFTPSVYSRFRKIGMRFQRKKKPADKKKGPADNTKPSNNTAQTNKA